jgi:hypothetical protein
MLGAACLKGSKGCLKVAEVGKRTPAQHPLAQAVGSRFQLWRGILLPTRPSWARVVEILVTLRGPLAGLLASHTGNCGTHVHSESRWCERTQLSPLQLAQKISATGRWEREPAGGALGSEVAAEGD